MFLCSPALLSFRRASRLWQDGWEKSVWFVALSGGDFRNRYASLEGAPGPRGLRRPAQDAAAPAANSHNLGDGKHPGVLPVSLNFRFRRVALETEETRRAAALAN